MRKDRTDAGVYIIEISTGTVKIGRSRDVFARLLAHRRAEATYGFTITQFWFTFAEDDARVERQIIDRYKSLGHKPIDLTGESFDTLTFANAVKHAQRLVHRGQYRQGEVS